MSVSGPGAGAELVLATHNEHKRLEFERLLADGGPASIALRALPAEVELPPEDADTFSGNALGKAAAAAPPDGNRGDRRRLRDLPPRRWEGRRGCARRATPGSTPATRRTLRSCSDEAPAGSRLEYVCVIAYVDPGGGLERCFEGRCGGRLSAAPRGSGGFGYDPAFEPDDGPPGRTMAELSDAAEGRHQPPWPGRQEARRMARYKRLMAAAIATARPSPA